MVSERDRRIVEAPNVASVATLMPDGTPHVSTIWIDLDGDYIVFNTSEGRVKIANSAAILGWRSACSTRTIPTSRW